MNATVSRAQATVEACVLYGGVACFVGGQAGLCGALGVGLGDAASYAAWLGSLIGGIAAATICWRKPGRWLTRVSAAALGAPLVILLTLLIGQPWLLVPLALAATVHLLWSLMRLGRCNRLAYPALGCVGLGLALAVLSWRMIGTSDLDQMALGAVMVPALAASGFVMWRQRPMTDSGEG